MASFVTGEYEYVRIVGLRDASLKFQPYVTQVFKDQIAMREYTWTTFLS